MKSEVTRYIENSRFLHFGAEIYMRFQIVS